MTPADRKTFTLMLQRALEYEGSLMGSLDGRDGALLDRRCEQNIVRFKACALRLLEDADRLKAARTIIRDYTNTVGIRPKRDIINVDERARAWLATVD